MNSAYYFAGSTLVIMFALKILEPAVATSFFRIESIREHEFRNNRTEEIGGENLEIVLYRYTYGLIEYSVGNLPRSSSHLSGDGGAFFVNDF